MKRLSLVLLTILIITAAIGGSGCGKSYSVYGRVVDGLDHGIANVTITFSGGYSGTTTDADGNWSKAGLQGVVFVTPSKLNWTFSPSNKQVTDAATDVDFVGEPNPPVLTRIEISPSSWTMNEGTEKTFIATGYDQYDAVFTINPTWSTTGGIGSVSPETGTSTTLTASLVASNISGTIKATVGLINDSSSVTVNNVAEPPVLTSIEVSPGTWSMQDGQSKQFTAIGYDQYGAEFAINPSWSIMGDIGTVDPTSGNTTTFMASEVGTGRVVATHGIKSDYANITVNPASSVLTTLVISPSSAELQVGDQQEFTAQGYDQYGAEFAINPSWSVTGGIGSVDPTSGDTIAFTAEAIGTGTVIATQATKSDYSEISVGPAAPKLTTMEIVPASWAMTVGSTKVFEVFGYDQYGDDFPPTEEVFWDVEGGIGYTRDAGGSNQKEFVATAAGEGHLVATSSSVVAYADISVTSSFTLSGVIEDSETDTPVAGVEVRAYIQDGGNGILAGTAICDASGQWSMELQVPPDVLQVVLQAGATGYFIRTKGYSTENASGILMRIVPDDLEGFKQFMTEAVGSLTPRFDPTDFEKWVILTQNPTGTGSFTPEQAEYIRSLILDSNNKIGAILNTEGYPVVIDPAEPYTPGSGRIYTIPDTTLPLGNANIYPYTSSFNVRNGGVIRMNPTYMTESNLKRFTLHETGHLIYHSHPTTTDSMMHTPTTQEEYRPLDLKGTHIANEPTYIGTADGDYSNVIDYLSNILKESWGLSGTAGY